MRRRYWIIVTIGAGLILIGLTGLFIYLRSPYWAFRQIVSAIERKDIDTVYDFVLDEEKKAGITKEVVSRVFEDILYKHAKIVRACRTPLEKLQGKESSDFYRFYCGWMDGLTGKPLSSFRKTGRVMTLQIELYRPTGRGWQMNFTKMALSYFVINFPQDQAGQAFRLYFKKWGISGIYGRPPHIVVRGRIKHLWDKPQWRKLPP